MVAMSVWPTDAADGSVASEARWRKMGRYWEPSGVVGGQGGELAPSLAGLNLTVQSGAAWVDGHYTELTSTQVLAATANGLAVVRFDPAANTADLLWRDAVSVPAQSPTGTWELPIAKTVGSVLTDMRVIPGVWRTYTPNWVGTGGNPAIGNGTIGGRFMQRGKVCTAVIKLTFGSTTAGGAGTLLNSLPVPANNNAGVYPIGEAYLFVPSIGNFTGTSWFHSDYLHATALFPMSSTRSDTGLWSASTSGGAGSSVPLVAAGYCVQPNGVYWNALTYETL